MRDNDNRSVLTLLVDGKEITYRIDPQKAYRGATCEVYAAESEQGDRVIIKKFHSNEQRQRQIHIINRLFEQYGRDRGNYFMGFCRETDASDEYPYCHIFHRIYGCPLQETICPDKEPSHASLLGTLQAFTGLLDGVSHLHKLGYAHWDIKPQNIYSFRATSGGAEIIQLIDFDAAIDKSYIEVTADPFVYFELDAQETAASWYLPEEISEAGELQTEDNALQWAQALDVFACARILAYMIFTPNQPAPLSLEDIRSRLKASDLREQFGLGSVCALQRFFEKALHRDLTERFISCKAMKDYLRELLVGLDTNQEVTTPQALRIRLGNAVSEEDWKFYEGIEEDILSEFQTKTDPGNSQRFFSSLPEAMRHCPGSLQIVGEGGIGKTYALRKEFYDRLFSADDSTEPALYIHLKGVQKASDITNHLNTIRQNHRATHFQPSYVFLDAFDECVFPESDKLDKGRISPDSLLQLLAEEYSETVFVVSSRFDIAEKAVSSGKYFSHTLLARGLTDNQLQRYLNQKRLNLKLGEFSNPALIELLKIPLMLTLFIEIWNDTKDPKDQAKFLRTADEVSLINAFIENRVHARNEEGSLSSENLHDSLDEIARCLHDNYGHVEEKKGLMKSIIKKLDPFVRLKDGQLSFSHQIFEDYFEARGFALLVDELEAIADEEKNDKQNLFGLVPGSRIEEYNKKLEVVFSRYRHSNKTALRFRGICIAARRGQEENLYESLNARVQRICEYHAKLRDSEKKAQWLVNLWIIILTLSGMPMTILYWFYPDQFTAIASTMSLPRRILVLLPFAVFIVLIVRFANKYVTVTFCLDAEKASKKFFDILCLCQYYGDNGLTCTVPPTITTIDLQLIDSQCKKLILGKDLDHIDHPSHCTVEEIDCSLARHFRFEQGCLYYRNRYLLLLSKGKSPHIRHIHIPRGVSLEWMSPDIIQWNQERICILSVDGRIRKGGLSNAIRFNNNSSLFSDQYAYFVFDGNEAQWNRITKSEDPFVPSKIQIRYRKKIARDSDWKPDIFLIPLWLTRFYRSGMGKKSESYASYLAEKNRGIEPRIVFHDSPMASQVINDQTVPANSYLNNRDCLALSCPLAVSVDTLAFSDSFIMTLDLPVCQSIGSGAFSMSVIHTLDLPACLTIGSYAFRDSCIQSIKLPVCQTIGLHAFENTENLEHIECPQVKVIEGAAFFGAGRGHFSISLPSCKRIAHNAFSSSSLSEIHAPLVSEIDNHAFSYCRFRTIALPSCTHIGAEAFHKCSVLSEITLTNMLQTIGYMACSQCDNLRTITFLGTVDEWKAVKKYGSICDHTLVIKCSDGCCTEQPPLA